MKKTIFTFCSVVAVCALIFLACNKDDTNYKQVSYSSQTTYGTGNNPNPNNNPSSGGVTTSPTPTVAPTYGSFNDGTSHTFTSSTTCGGAAWTGTYSGGSITLTFSAAPTTGTYTTVASTPAAGQVVMNCLGGTANAGGTVTVTSSGGKLTAAFPNLMVNTTPISGSLTCM